MPDMIAYPILAAGLLVTSWLISFIGGYLLVRYAVRRSKKPWNEMTAREQTYVRGLSSSGCFLGGLFLLVFVGTTRLLGTHPQLDISLVLVWALIAVVLTAIAGVLPIRQLVSSKPQEEHELAREVGGRPAKNEQP
jgi:hypothetical protein